MLAAVARDSVVVTARACRLPIYYRLYTATDLGHRILKSDFCPVGFYTIGLHEKTDYFSIVENENLKLGVESHRNQPQEP